MTCIRLGRPEIVRSRLEVGQPRTMDKTTTHGRFSDLIISIESDVFPDPELPAMPMMLTSAHGGL